MFVGDIVTQTVQHYLDNQGLNIRERPASVRSTKSEQRDQEEEEEEERQVQCRTPFGYIKWRRSLRLGLLGFFWRAPNQLSWYSIMERLLPGHKLHTVLLKVGVTQSTFAIWMNMSTIFLAQFTASWSPSMATQKVRYEIWAVLKQGWCFWPFVNLLNFGVVPMGMRVVVDSIASLFWGCYLCYVFSKTLPQPKVQPQMKSTKGQASSSKRQASP